MTRMGPAVLARNGAPDLAYEAIAGKGPTLVWLGGFRSDMTGSKATRLAEAAGRRGRAFLRFDYAGCGASGGRFEDQTIGAWRQDALDMIEQRTSGPLVLVGSSMGGWLGLLAALARPERVQGLVLIAPAPDFTERLMRPALPPEAHAALSGQGVWMRPSPYGDGPYPITARLLDEARSWLLLGDAIPFSGPVRILHGQADADVPWTLSLELCERLDSRDVEVTLIKSGDHRLSTEPDLDLLEQKVFGLAERLA